MANLGIRDERLNRAASMPHRSLAGDDRLDARLESELGRLFFERQITQTEYEAGVRYARITLEYLESIDSPSPYSGDIGAIEDDVCFRRKLNFCAARDVLRTVGGRSATENRCSIVVDRVAVYDEPCRDDLEFHALRVGLRALAGFDA